MKPGKRAPFASRKAAWVFLLVITLLGLAIVLAPVWIIQPFKPQSARGVEVSYALRRWSPWITLAALAFGLFLIVRLWRGSGRWWKKALLVIVVIPMLASTWFARQNHFEWIFNPLANAAYAKTSETGLVDDADIVLAVESNGEAAAYPVRLMAPSPGAGRCRRHSDSRYLLNALSHRSGVGNDSRRAPTSLPSGGN